MLNLADPVITRAFWAAIIIIVGLSLYALANHLMLLRAQRGHDRHPDDLPFQQGADASILYFTTPECQPCKTIQRPALQRLQERLGDRLQVVEIDATQRPDLASRWGVLSVPTTFLIDRDGRLRHVNHGATRAEKLLNQLKAIL